ncbi:MAG: hypothetical protein JSS49_26955 [Planctomycetes bacterium]|nr:hypothetical protein [Planctomycetota bacterium]
MSILAGIVEGFLNSFLQFGFAFKSDNLDHEFNASDEPEDCNPPAEAEADVNHETSHPEQD